MLLHKIKYVIVWLILVSNPARANFDPLVTASNLFVVADASVKVSNIQGHVNVQGKGGFLTNNIGSLTNTGDLTLNNVNIMRDMAFGGSLTQKASHAGSVTPLAKPGPDYSTINKGIIDDSIFLGSLQQNGAMEINSIENVMTLTGTNPNLNVFVTEPLWFHFSLKINAPKGSTVIINMPGEQVDMSLIAINKMQNGRFDFDPTHLLLNFPQAQTVSLEASTISGTILAPRANFNTQAVNIQGSLITNGLTMSTSNLYEYRFQGHLPTSDSRTISAPEPRLTWILSVIFLVITTDWQNRRPGKAISILFTPFRMIFKLDYSSPT